MGLQERQIFPLRNPPQWLPCNCCQMHACKIYKIYANFQYLKHYITRKMGYFFVYKWNVNQNLKKINHYFCNFRITCWWGKFCLRRSRREKWLWRGAASAPWRSSTPPWPRCWNPSATNRGWRRSCTPQGSGKSGGRTRRTAAWCCAPASAPRRADASAAPESAFLTKEKKHALAIL